MKFFDKYNLKNQQPQQIKEDYERLCSAVNGIGIYNLDNLEDASSYLFVAEQKTYLVEKFQNYQDYIGVSTRVCYKNNDDFYCVGENLFVGKNETSEATGVAKSYEGFVVSNGESIELTQVNAEFVYECCKYVLESNCTAQLEALEQ